MARTATDGPELAKWLASSSRTSASQYASLLRPLFLTCNPVTVTTDFLVDHVLAQKTESNRRKVVTAIKTFFGDFLEARGRSDDPSHRLDVKVRETKSRRERRALLVRAGVTDHSADELCWNSVLSSMICEATADIETQTIASLEMLESEMLERLGGISAERFRSLMRERIA